MNSKMSEKEIENYINNKLYQIVKIFMDFCKSKDAKEYLTETAYKWNLLEETVDKNIIEISLIMIKSKYNFIDSIRLAPLIKYLATNKTKEYNSIVLKLYDESKNLSERILQFNNEIKELFGDVDKKSLPNDERTASVLLACHNSKKYTYYMDTYYKNLCDFLNIDTKKTYYKYEHYMSLIYKLEFFINKEKSFFTELSKEYLGDANKNLLMWAQNILWTLFYENFIANYDKNYLYKEENISMPSSNPLIEQLQKTLLKSHNLILHGAPGTGKSHLAKEIACEMGCKDNEIGFVQFHPSYDYTDFVEGLRPVQNVENSNIGFERKDGVFKEFCKKALQNYLDSQKSVEVLQQEKSIKDVLGDFLDNAIDNNIEFETVTKNKFFIKNQTEKNIIVEIPENEKVKELSVSISEINVLLTNNVELKIGKDVSDFLNRKWRTQQDSYIFVLVNKIQELQKKSKKNISTIEKVSLKPFVFIIDEINRGEVSKIFGELFYSIEAGYRGEKGKVFTQYQNLVEDGDLFKDGFFVPENVYIIGTMNDIDRSVESMDFAFRRRFAWKEIKAEVSKENGNTTIFATFDNDLKAKAIICMNNLNNAIYNDKTKEGIEGLNSSYHIGASYFLKLNDFEGSVEEKFKKLWDYHLEGLLLEYLRGSSDIEEKIEILKKAYEGGE